MRGDCMNKFELATMVFNQCSISTRSNCVRIVSVPEETALMYWNFTKQKRKKSDIDVSLLFDFLSECECVRILLDLESCVIDFCFPDNTDIGEGAVIGKQAEAKPLNDLDFSDVVFNLDLDDAESKEDFAAFIAEQLKTDATVIKLDSIGKWNALEETMAPIVARNPDVWEVVGPDEREDVLYYSMEIVTMLGYLESYAITINNATLRRLVKAMSITESVGFGFSRNSKGTRLEFMLDIDSVYLDA